MVDVFPIQISDVETRVIKCLSITHAGAEPPWGLGGASPKVLPKKN
jgi:hypothetical protein